MKKLLLASTVLVATAAVATADVILDPDVAETSSLQFSGLGRFGVGYVEDRDRLIGANPEVGDTILVSRFRLNIDANAETDGGVEFSARVRLRAEENPLTGEANGADTNGARFSVIYGGLRVDVGNVGGAFDNLANYYGAEPGLESFAGQYSGVNYGPLGYSGGGTGHNAVFFNYEVGSFGVAASYNPRYLPQNSNATDNWWDISATYQFGNITAAVAHGQAESKRGNGDDPSLTVLTLNGEMGDFSATLFIADEDVLDDISTNMVDESQTLSGSAYGVSASYSLGATSLLFAYGDGSADADTQWIAVGANYDLGGGVSLRGGIGRRSATFINSTREYNEMRADFGAQFNF